MVLPSLNPRILLTSMQQHSQTTPHPLQCYIPDHKRAEEEGENWLDVRQNWRLQQTFLIERFEAVNHEGQIPCTWIWWDPQQSVEKSPCGHTEDPKRDPKQDMDLCGFSSSVESSNGDPDLQTKQGTYWPSEL